MKKLLLLLLILCSATSIAAMDDVLQVTEDFFAKDRGFDVFSYCTYSQKGDELEEMCWDITQENCAAYAHAVKKGGECKFVFTPAGMNMLIESGDKLKVLRSLVCSQDEGVAKLEDLAADICAKHKDERCKCSTKSDLIAKAGECVNTWILGKCNGFWSDANPKFLENFYGGLFVSTTDADSYVAPVATGPDKEDGGSAGDEFDVDHYLTNTVVDPKGTFVDPKSTLVKVKKRNRKKRTSVKDKAVKGKGKRSSTRRRKRVCTNA